MEYQQPSQDEFEKNQTHNENIFFEIVFHFTWHLREFRCKLISDAFCTLLYFPKFAFVRESSTKYSCDWIKNPRNLEFGFLFFCHSLCRILAAKSWLASCKWWRKPEYLAKTTAYPQVTGNFLNCQNGLPLCCWYGLFGQYKIMRKTWIMTETLANGYTSESTQRELSNEYQHDRDSMFFKTFCVLVLWTKVASALEGLIIPDKLTGSRFNRAVQQAVASSLRGCKHFFLLNPIVLG